MKHWLRKLAKFIAYLAAGTVILLAVAVGLFRLFLPRLPEYQEEIKGWASAAIGMQVEFSGMDARWGLSGPELEFYDTELIRPDSEIRVVAAKEVRIGVSLVRLLVDRTLIVDRLVIRETSIEVRQLEDGSFWVQGSRVDDLLALRSSSSATPAAIDLIGEQLELSFMQPGDERPHFFQVPQVQISVNERRIAADADIQLPDNLGRQLSVSATQVLSMPPEERMWDVAVDADDINLRGWSGLSGGERQLAAGLGDAELSIALGHGQVSNATAALDFVDVALEEGKYFDVSGRIEIDLADDGWLVAANDFVIARDGREWPESQIRVETSTDSEGAVVMLNAHASFLDLQDVTLALPWLGEAQRERVAAFDPSGIVRELEATVSEIGAGEPRFSVSAEVDDVGIAAEPGRPGIRGFSAIVRASHSGGSAEIQAARLTVDAAEILGNDVEIETADSIVFWRQRGDEFSIWSDGLQLANEFFSSYSDVDLTFRDGSTAPEVELSGTWSISDVAAAKRLLPQKLMNAQLYEWFQAALVGGAIPHGTAELRGPMAQFPFDGGEGQLLVNASVRNLHFKYHRDWPAAEQADLEVVLNNMRLYSERNRSTNAGNTVVDATFDIPDLRDPVLRIESISTGTLESIRQFSMQSPISQLFGGQLDRVQVAGDASFTLDLQIPLRRERVREFGFVGQIRTNDGSIRVDGFDPPVTEISGDVMLSRDTIISESLRGVFLGQAVSIDVARAEDEQFSVVASAIGTLTADAVVNELGVPLEGLVEGETSYEARILFPRGNVDTPSPLTIRVASDFEGFAFNVPSPIGKPAHVRTPIRGDIRFLPDGEVIESSGVAENQLTWQVAFNKPEGNWDFDRGVVTFGDGIVEPADVRGLHIRGSTGTVDLHEWLALSRRGAKNAGAADRIRSIDLQIEEFHVLGQRLLAHRVRVDRSARDWLVQLEGEDVTGSVFVPYEFGGERSMVLEMEKLRLPGDDAADENGFEATIDPRDLPPIQLKAAEFAFGDRYIGEVEAEFEKTADGLESATLRTKDPTFEIVGDGRWIVDESDPLGSRTYITATLASSDVTETMRRLNYEPGIDSDSMNMLFNLEWSGSPRADFFEVLDGEVQVRLSNGQLEEVEPGAGRVFGLVSIAALPRRLSLDFSDVFNKGFGFDRIAGTFRIDDGSTYTCDLALEGPAANIGIVGEADLSARTYNQTAVVTANVGNTLPIVGAVVAGPQAAAALLIFSRIFKKPIEQAGQVYYGIDGSWDEPMVDSSNSEAFVASSEIAGCLAGAE